LVAGENSYYAMGKIFPPEYAQNRFFGITLKILGFLQQCMDSYLGCNKSFTSRFSVERGFYASKQCYFSRKALFLHYYQQLSTLAEVKSSATLTLNDFA
jgi:hypothetical protein